MVPQLLFVAALLPLSAAKPNVRKPAMHAQTAQAPEPAGDAAVDSEETAEPGALHLAGLSSPAEVTQVLHLRTRDLAPGAVVTYFLDDQPAATTREAPYWMSNGELPRKGFSLDGIAPGPHTLRAEAALPGGEQLRSATLRLVVHPSIAARFSPGLAAYANQPGAQEKTVKRIVEEASTPGFPLAPEEAITRRRVTAMYRNLGIDLALDSEHDQSAELLARTPQGWATRSNAPASLAMRFSPDAPFYQAIPGHWPRVPLPAGYITDVQLNTVKNGDGIGFGETVAAGADLERTVQSQWYTQTSTFKSFPFRMKDQWWQALPAQPDGDMHMIFVDPETHRFFSSYKTSRNASTGGPDALFASSPTSLDTLGDNGGSIAAGFAELPTMLQPGEATDPQHAIGHALGGPVGRAWAARVFPANARDANVRTSTNSCTGTGITNTGLVPYGGVIQLDPELDLHQFKLTLPALRILQAIQTYGYYVEDFGCASLDIYTAIDETELDPFGGLWGYNRKGVGVQNEIMHVLDTQKLFVVAPLIKR